MMLIFWAEFGFAEVPQGLAGMKLGDTFENIKSSHNLIANKQTGQITEEEKKCGMGDYFIIRNNNERINLTFSNFVLTEIVYANILPPEFDISTLAERFKEKYGKPSKEKITLNLVNLDYNPSNSSVVDEFSIWIYYQKSGDQLLTKFGISPDKLYFYYIKINSKNKKIKYEVSKKCIKDTYITKTKDIIIPD